MDDLFALYVLILFQSHQDNGRVIMESSGQ